MSESTSMSTGSNDSASSKESVDTCNNIMITVVENYRKSRIQHCEQSELCLHFEWKKSWLKMRKMVNFGEFLKDFSLQSNSGTRQVTFKQKWVENAKNWKKSNATFWEFFKHFENMIDDPVKKLLETQCLKINTKCLMAFFVNFQWDSAILR